jgi:hypothetical protein
VRRKGTTRRVNGGEEAGELRLACGDAALLAKVARE